MKKSILDIDIIAVCQSACGSAGITANGLPLAGSGGFGTLNYQTKIKVKWNTKT